MDIIYPPRSDDGTLSEDSPLYKWATLLLQTFAAMGSPLDSALKYKEQLEAAGFVDVHVVQRKWPMNRWPKAKIYKQIEHHGCFGGDKLGCIYASRRARRPRVDE
ncbi:hypothetical protein Neosp_004300 [[Neocosmospora] mangrovei]